MTRTMPTREMPKAYEPRDTEKRIYDLWMQGNYFEPKVDLDKKPFVIMMPPPNVTGELHMGHALTMAVEDMLVRWHRMKGDPTLYLPGTDHAGIATQVVVERMLAGNNITRHDMGREKFLATVWNWVDRYGDRIYEQIKRLGASCDWSRQSFTLDEAPSKAVRTTFVNLYKKKLIYRGERIVNWCPRCATALSDLEVRHRDENAKLYYIHYRLGDNDDIITIATTRPETLLGDTAVAVNPNDDRYTHLIGREAILPILGRSLPIIGDEFVDPEFGTGALKVTPGHDHDDFEIGQRHDLPIINVMNLDATMNENAGPYSGMDRADVREKITSDLDSNNQLGKAYAYHHSVGHCDRCNETVEPLVSNQWYMKMKPLAQPAIDAVANGQIRIIPKHFTKIYFNWMHNIRDWTISRQLWWGHQIPVWYCDNCDEITVEIEDPTECGSCGSSKLNRDPDVLDTWFSSGLWPHSTLGWPENTPNMDYFYPTSVLETGYDILFFWVARMIMLGIENTNDIPFDTVYLHGLVLDPNRIKMSKVKGNVTDPIDLIDLYGADALRFALTTGNTAGLDMRLNESKIEASRNFANKLWNASRYVMTNLDTSDSTVKWELPRKDMHLEDRWIVSRLHHTITQVDTFMGSYQLGEAQRVVHDFMWDEYCDWYLEMSKVRLRMGDTSPLPVLIYVLDRLIRLLHPFMPFITEELFQQLSKYIPEELDRPDAVIMASYPKVDETLFDEDAEKDIGSIIELVRAVRNVRADFRIRPTQNVEVIAHTPDIRSIVESESAAIMSLGKINPLRQEHGDTERASDEGISLVLSSGTLTISLEGLVDLDLERNRISNELEELDNAYRQLSVRLDDEKFTTRAPEEVVERERQRLEDIKDRRVRIVDTLSRLE